MDRMGRKWINIIIFLWIGDCWAGGVIATETTVPPATGIEVIVHRVDSRWTASPYDDYWKKIKGNELDFEELKERRGRTWIIYLPRYYFVLDIHLVGGGFEPERSIMVEYLSEYEESPPPAKGGLAKKASITYVKVKGRRKQTTETFLEKKLFGEDNMVPLWKFLSGWLRLYIGINTGEEDPAGAELFTPSDPPGKYRGAIRVSLL